MIFGKRDFQSNDRSIFTHSTTLCNCCESFKYQFYNTWRGSFVCFCFYFYFHLGLYFTNPKFLQGPKNKKIYILWFSQKYFGTPNPTPPPSITPTTHHQKHQNRHIKTPHKHPKSYPPHQNTTTQNKTITYLLFYLKKKNKKT